MIMIGCNHETIHLHTGGIDHGPLALLNNVATTGPGTSASMVLYGPKLS